MTPNFLLRRPRRLRATPALRALVRETTLSPADLVAPFFVRPGRGQRRPVKSMPGVFQLSTDELAREVRKLKSAGVPALILFGIPDRKDAKGSGAWARNGIVQQAVKAAKDAAPELAVITDVCLCEYTDHGHCGVIRNRGVDNDATLPLIARAAVSHAEAGADVVAPSGMMDGGVGAIRAALDGAGRTGVPILAYSAKYASSFYGPFRDAAESPPKFGDRSGYQMDPANGDEAMLEIQLDLEQGADAVMVKPAHAYLDIIRRAKERFSVPVAAYHVSGEYSMIQAAAERGWIDGKRAAVEVLTSIKRAGADFILSYFAPAISDLIS